MCRPFAILWLILGLLPGWLLGQADSATAGGTPSGRLRFFRLDTACERARPPGLTPHAKRSTS